MITTFGKVLILGITVMVALLNTCNKPIDYLVVIEYEEAAVFSEFDTPPAPGGSVPIKTFAGQGLIVAYKIISIKNTDTGAKDFSFDPNKVFVNSEPRAKMAGGVLAPFSTVKPLLVQKGTTASPVGRIIINIPGNPNDIKNSENLLLYESGPGESVIFTRRAATKKVLDPATPNNLP